MDISYIWGDIGKKVSQCVPKGIIYDYLRSLYRKTHQVIRMHDAFCSSLKFEKRDDFLELFFQEGPLKDFSLLFPNYDETKEWIHGVAFDLPGYFQRPEIYDSLTDGSICIDAGSYPGDWTVIAAKKVGSRGKVFSFEPDPVNRDYLREMIDINGLKNVEIIDFALSSKEKDTYIRSAVQSSVIDENANVKVSCISLDSFIQQADLSSLDIVKMDIEGSEIGALQGAHKTIDNFHPAFMIASYHLVEGKKTSTFVENFLSERYPFVETLYSRHLTTYAYFR